MPLCSPAAPATARQTLRHYKSLLRIQQHPNGGSPHWLRPSSGGATQPGARATAITGVKGTAATSSQPTDKWRLVMEEGSTLPRVLSVQSHVVHGYVGNKCAVFPLQLLGMEVDPVYSVQFSNHTGYPTFRGPVFDGDQLQALAQGLEENKLLTHTHLLTGYIGSLSLLKAIADLCSMLKRHSPNLTYVCDPVLGDEGRLYVSPELVEAYRTTIVPLASVMVPNQFEAEQLTGGRPITDLASALAACDELHARGPHTVIITSSTLTEDPDSITLVASTTLPQRGAAGEGEAEAGGAAKPHRLRMRVDRIRAYFTGTGDLFAALLLAWMHHHPGDLRTAVEKAVGGLQAVLGDTVRHCGPAALAAERTAEVCAARELRLIPNQAKLLDPPVKYRCEVVEG